MTPADEVVANIKTAKLADAVASSDHDHKLDERTSVENLQRTSDQKPVERLDNLLFRISHHLDYETSERATIYHRLVAIDSLTKRIESQTKRRASRAFVRFLVAICIGVAGTLAWQSCGEPIKQTIATRAPELGWSPETKQTIASWTQHLGSMKPLADSDITAAQPSVPHATQTTTIAQSAPEAVAPKVPVVPSLDTEKVQQITLDLAALRQSVEQLAAGQEQMSREIEKLQAADAEILLRIPTPPPPQTPAASPRKPIPTPPSSRASIPVR